MFSRFQMREFEKGSFFMILSSLMSVFFSFFVKLSSAMVYLPLVIFLRFFIPCLILIPYFLRYKAQIKEINFKKTHMHVLRGISILISQFSLFYYFTKAPLTDGVLLYNTGPLFIPLISLIFFQIRVSRGVWLSLCVSFIGVILVLKPHEAVFDFFSLYGFSAGFFVALSQVLYGVNRDNQTIPQNIFLFFTYSSILSLIIFLISLNYISLSEIWSITAQHGTLMPVVGVLGVCVGTIMNQYLRGKAFGYAKPASLAPFIYLAVLFAALLDLFLYPETLHGFNFIVGMLLVFLGTLGRMVYASRA